MIYFCLSFFLFLLPIIFLLIYIFIKIEKIESRQTKTEAKIEREYQHLLNNIKNIENFLKNENEK